MDDIGPGNYLWPRHQKIRNNNTFDLDDAYNLQHLSLDILIFTTQSLEYS